MTLRIGLIGAGIGAQHLAALRELPEMFEVVLICDRDVARAEGIADGTRVTGELDDVLAADLDIIDICLPPHLHVPVALKALEAGKHVVCEKPLACSLADIDRLDAAATAAGREVFPVFQYRYGPAMARMRALLEAGIPGKALVGTLETHWDRRADYYAIPWRGTWDGEQGGAVLGHAIHIHDLVSVLLGPVARVSGALATRANAIETEDCAALTFEMASGALVTSSVTLGATGDQSRMRLVFEHMTVESDTLPYAPMEGDWRFHGKTPDVQMGIDRILAEAPVGRSGFAGFFQDIAQALTGADHSAVDLAAGRASVGLVTAIYKAAREGGGVSLPILDGDPTYRGWRP